MSPYDEKFCHERDRRLRAQMLSVLHLARSYQKGGLSGDVLIDVVEGNMASEYLTEDHGHALGLIRDLVHAGYVSETKNAASVQHRRNGFAPKFLFLRITERGSKLHLEAIKPDPLVYDQRVGGEDE